MSFEYKQAYSFRAELYWRDGLNGDNTLHRIGATFDGSTPLKHNDGWLFAGKDNYTKYNNVVCVREVIKMDFWFGCYVDSGSYGYDVRAISLTRDNFYYAARIETSRNGFLGLYHPGHDRQEPHDKELWRLDGVDPRSLKPDDLLLNMRLRNSDDVVAHRKYEDGIPYLVCSGEGFDGLTARVVETGQPYPY